MKHGANRRLANVKTRTETGLDYVLSQIDLNTPFGKALRKRQNLSFRVKKRRFGKNFPKSKR